MILLIIEVKIRNVDGVDNTKAQVIVIGNWIIQDAARFPSLGFYPRGVSIDRVGCRLDIPPADPQNYPAGRFSIDIR